MTVRFVWGQAVIALARTAMAEPRLVTDADRDAVRGQPEARAWERLAARGLLRGLLAETVGAGPAAAVLSAYANGKPYLQAWPDVRVSLSHSGGWVAAGVNRGGALGVDVQVPASVTPGLLARCLSDGDLAVVRDLEPGEQARRFAWVWSAQEACVKATGGGFRARPWSIPVGLGQPAGRWGEVEWKRLPSNEPVALSAAKEVSR
jgi:4'-phosphopantetheinyl transferase